MSNKRDKEKREKMMNKIMIVQILMILGFSIAIGILLNLLNFI